MLEETIEIEAPKRSRPRLEARRWQPEPIAAGGPLDAAIERSRGWCRTWWARSHAAKPWLLAIPDVGPSCEVLLADALFHDLRPDEREGLLGWIRSQQQPDGSWRDGRGEPDLSLTCLGYWARIQGGDDPEDEQLVKALRVVHELGGARRANLTVRLWLALAGTVEWDWVPAVPSELYLLPEFAPLSPARLSPWSRQLVTALHLLASGPARVHLCDASELLLYKRGSEPIPPRLTTPGLAGDLLQAFDASIKLARKLPRGAIRRRSLARARQWIEASQQAHGGWFSARPTLYNLLALRAVGVMSDDPRLRRGLDYLRRARGIVEVEGRELLAQGLTGRPQALVARLGLAAGAGPGEPAEGLRERLLAAEITRPGPWQRRADAPTGGWPEEPEAESHLDVRTTCEVLASLRGARTSATRASLRRAAEVVLAMQEPDGSFAWFERGESDVPLSHLPWRDADQLNLGAPEDESRVVLCAMAVRELAALGWRREDDRIRRALTWLGEAHTLRGHGWSVSTLAALVRATVAQCLPNDPLRIAAERQLRSKQWEDGSFGDELATARALLALIDCGQPCVQAHRAARHLVSRVGAIAREQAGEAPTCPDHALPGYGLSPRLCDPSAGAREIQLALTAFRRELGDLEDRPD
ncbi:MAG: prenyltransferase/squalene oxidase repeat-containing protein [Enhygromyxa sp.]